MRADFDLRLALNDKTSCFGDPLFRRSNGGSIGFYCLSRGDRFGLTRVVIGARDLVLFD